jgi:hypothetical protein
MRLCTRSIHLFLPILILQWLVIAITIPVTLYAQDVEFEELLKQGKEEFKKGEAAKNTHYEHDNLDSIQRHFAKAIEILEKASALNPRSQESLYFQAYAYDRLASLSSPGNSLPNTTLAATLKISRLLEGLFEISPRYDGEPWILGPYSKLTATWGSLALSYAEYGKIDSTRWAFQEGKKRGGFPDPVLEFCRNALRSCEKNAILLVNGDDDTFPMWYVQFIEGFRSDVTVINLRLSNTHWYIKGLKSRYPFGVNPLQIGLSDGELDTITYLTTTYLIRKEPLPTSLRVGENARKQFGRMIGKKDTIMSWSIAGQRYGEQRIIIAQDFILMYLLQTNDWKRPVYYCATVDDGGAFHEMGLGEFLRIEGLASRITPVRRSLTERLVDPDRLQRLLLSTDNGFDWNTARSKAAQNDTNAFGMLKLYVDLFMELARYRNYVDKSPRMVAQVMKRMDEVLPVDALARSYCQLLGPPPAPRFWARVSEMAELFQYGGNKKRYAELMRIIDEETKE